MISFWAGFSAIERWCAKYGQVILPILVATVAVLIAWMAMTRDEVRALQNEDATQKSSIARVEKSTAEDRIAVKGGIEKIDGKVDALDVKIDVKLTKINDSIIQIWQSAPPSKRKGPPPSAP